MSAPRSRPDNFVHHLRNRLTVIQGRVELLLRRLDRDPQPAQSHLRRELGIIQEQTSLLAQRLDQPQRDG